MAPLVDAALVLDGVFAGLLAGDFAGVLIVVFAGVLVASEVLPPAGWGHAGAAKAISNKVVIANGREKERKFHRSFIRADCIN